MEYFEKKSEMYGGRKVQCFDLLHCYIVETNRAAYLKQSIGFSQH